MTPLLFLLAGCGDEPTGTDSAAPTDTAPIGDSADTTDTTTTDTADPCADVPTVNYNNFGHGFMTENCQGCHASTAPDRYGAPESVTFDTLEEVWALADRILARSAGDDASMPPAGGVSQDDRTRLEWWLRCAEEGT